MEHQDIKSVISTLISKWYYFAIALMITFGLAYLYISAKQKEYLVTTTLRLDDQSLASEGGTQQPKQFLNGVELLANTSAIQDEIGVLTSFSTFNQALLALDFTVSYYAYDSRLGEIGTLWAKEEYPPSFRVNLDYTAPQLIHTPIHISFVDDSTYRVRCDEPEVWMHEFGSGNTAYVGEASFDETVQLNDTLSLPYLKFTLTDLDPEIVAGNKDYYIEIRDIKSLTESYLNRVEVLPIAKNSTIVELNLVGPTVEKETRFLNTLSTIYIENDKQKKSQFGMNTIRFIDKQLGNVSDTLKQVEQTLKSFRNDNRIIDIATTSQNLAQELNQLERDRAKLNVQSEYYRHIARYLENNRDVGDVLAPSAVGIDDHLLGSLLVDLSELYRERNEKQQSTSKLNPVYQLLERKIESTKRTLKENIDQLIESSNIQQRENQRSMARINSTINELPQNEYQLTNINRQFAFSDNIYNYLLQKRTEAGIAVASYVPNKNVIDTARRVGGGPVSPNKMIIYFLALITGLGFPAALVITQDYFNDRIRSRKQLAHFPQYPLVSTIPQGPKGSTIPVAEHPLSSISESFKYTQTNINYFFRDVDVKVIGVTSSIEGEGKSFCSENLATTYALSKQKTILLSFDLRKKKKKPTFPTSDVGIADYVMGNASIADIIQPTEFSNLHVIASREVQFNASLVLGDDKIAELFRVLRESYDKIIVDTPPFNYVSDYLILRPFFDVSLFVIRHNYTKQSTLEQAVDLLRTNQIDHLNFVYNGAQAENVYGYGYGQQPSKKSFSTNGQRKMLKKTS